MYESSAKYYDRIYHFKDYATASEKLVRLIDEIVPGARTLLDVACGTGQHLQHLKKRLSVEGLDLNAELLEIARRRCGNVPFHHADMIDFDLGRKFDVVTCLFSAIAYVKTAANLRRTIANLARHLTVDGAIFLEPYFTPTSYYVDVVTLNVASDSECKIAWMYVSRKEENVGIQDVHFLIGTPDGVRHFTEHHELGLFTDDDYQAAFAEAGLASSFDAVGLFGRGMYVARHRVTSS